jgi:uncharacterized membrane protein
MTGLILLLIIILLTPLVLLIILLGRTSEQQKLTESLYDRIKSLSDEIAGLTKEIKKLKLPAETKKIIVEEKPIQNVATPPPIIKQEEKKEHKKHIVEPEIEKPEPVRTVIEINEEVTSVEINEQSQVFKPVVKKETDLEKFIGENLANKIGIAVLLLGISFFVKYAIDKDWIKETSRVIVGLVAGGILIGIAHRIRHTYRSFSSVLMGGGITVFYFTIAFAFHQYELIGQRTAFGIMIFITAFAVLLALYYDRLELAVIATIGGFITPFLVTTGQENYTALFTYLSILNAGLMVLAWFKRWPTINIIALISTIIIYGGWVTKRLWFDYPVVLPYKDAMLFSTIFYLQFVAMNIVNNIRQKNNFNAFDFLVVLSVNFLFYLAGLIILSYWDNGDHKGLFTGLLGVFNLSLVFGFKQKRTIDRNFIALLTGLAITYISLIAPVQFKGNIVTLFWAAETVILFWLFQRTRILQLKIASVIVSILMLVSLLFTWIQIYFSGTRVVPILLNKGFSTTIAVAVSLFIYYKLLYKEADTYFSKNTETKTIRDLLLTTFIFTLYLSGALEIYYQFETRSDVESLFSIYLQLYTFAFVSVMFLIFHRSTLFPVFKFLFTTLCFGLYLVNIKINYQIAVALIEKNDSFLFFAHWLSVILLGWWVADLVIHYRKAQYEKWQSYLTSFAWLSSIGSILILSVEFYLINLWFNYKDADWEWWQNLYYKAGLSILWSICSFILMWLGMNYKFRTLRIISLTLFTVTLIKLFVYDITKIPPGGKIAAFILLGVLLLTVSFMYQKLKKIIIDENKNLED